MALIIECSQNMDLEYIFSQISEQINSGCSSGSSPVRWGFYDDYEVGD